MRNATLALCLAGAVALTACTPSEPSSAPAPDAGAPAADVAATTPATPATTATPAAATGVWFEPAALSACAPGNQIVNIHWNFADPAITQVKILVPSKDANGAETEGLFALTTPQGNKESGPWMGAGKTVIVRNAADDTELGRASVGSIPCQ